MMNRSNGSNDDGMNPPYENGSDCDESHEMNEDHDETEQSRRNADAANMGADEPLQSLRVDQDDSAEIAPYEEEAEDIFDKKWSELTVAETTVDRKGNNALHFATSLWTYNSENRKIWKLLERGFDPNKQNDSGMTPVHIAVMSENYEALNMLMAYGGDINALDNQGSAPMFHLRFCIDMQHLIKYKPNLKLRDGRGNDILQHFCKINANYVKPFIRLLGFGAGCKNVNFNGENCLHYLAEYNKFSDDHCCRKQSKSSLMRLIIRKGAKVNAKNSQHETPLHKAVEYDDDLLRVFLYAGGDVDIVNKNNESPLDIAMQRKDRSLREIIRYWAFRKHRGLTLAEKHLEIIHSCDSLEKLFDKYNRDLEILKLTRIIPSSPITLYNVISSNKPELIDIASNNDILSRIYSLPFYIQTEYMEEILSLAEEGQIMKEKEEAIDILTDIFGGHLPYLVIKLIVGFLSFEEIRIFISQSRQT